MSRYSAHIVHIYAKEIKISPNYIEPHYLWIHSDIF